MISRVINAPRELVFEAFTEVRHLSRWWGPDGFTTTTRVFEFHFGGEWVFATDGAATRIEMRTVFRTKELRHEVVEKYRAIEGGQQTLGNLAAYVTGILAKGVED